MTNYDEYRKRNHPLRDRFGEDGCQASAVLSRCERAGEGRGGCQTQVGCFRDQTWHFKRVDFLQIQPNEHQASQTESHLSHLQYTPKNADVK